MGSAAGRGAQVRLRQSSTHQAAVRGALGPRARLIDHILAKQQEETEGRGSDGLTFDGSTITGIPALDEVLTPGGVIDGIVGPSGPGQAAGSTGFAFGLTGNLTGRLNTPAGSLAGFTNLTMGLSGQLRGSTSLAGNTGITLGLSGTLTAPGAMAGSTGIKLDGLATASAAGPLAGSTFLRMRMGEGSFADTDFAMGLSGRLTGRGELVSADPWVVLPGLAATGYNANSTQPANSILPANSGTPDFNAHANSATLPANSTVPANQGFVASPTIGSGRVISTSLLGNLTGKGALVGGTGITFTTAGNLTGSGVAGLPPDTVTDRLGNPFTLRDGSYLQTRPMVSDVVTDRLGNVITLRDGSDLTLNTATSPDVLTSSRDGSTITLRDGSTVTFRTQPDVPVQPPPEPADPPPVVFPVGPHLHLVVDPQQTANFLLNREDGITADVRLVRPVFTSTTYATFVPHNTQATIVRMFTSNDFGLFGFNGADLVLLRNPTSADDGTYNVDYMALLSDNTTLELQLDITVAADATTQPDPTPPPTGPQVFYEPFNPGTGTGALTHGWSWDYVSYPDTGWITLNQLPDFGWNVGVMTFPGGASTNFGSGRFEFRVRYHGARLTNGGGPATICWPSDDIWPGSEIDLGEINSGGQFYGALHRRNPDGGWDEAMYFVVNDVIPGFTHDNRWITVACDAFADVYRYYVDGVLIGEVTDPAWLPKSYMHGGTNHCVGLLNGSIDTSLDCSGIRFTPESLCPPGPYVPFNFGSP